MGCNFSNEPVRVIEPQAIEEPKSSAEIEESDSGKRSSVTKSHDSFLSSNEDSIESDKLTLHSYGSDILSPHRSKSVDFKRNGSANRDERLPVAAATIIRNTSASVTPTTARRREIEMALPNQLADVSNPDVRLTSYNQNEFQTSKNSLSRRRSSDGDVGKVTSVTCIPRSLIKANPLLNSNLPEMRKKPPMFGPRNSRLTVTQSQKDFFKMLDERIAQGQDYCSEDERSLASFRSLSIHRKDSSESNGFPLTSIAQQVR